MQWRAPQLLQTQSYLADLLASLLLRPFLPVLLVTRCHSANLCVWEFEHYLESRQRQSEDSPDLLLGKSLVGHLWRSVGMQGLAAKRCHVKVQERDHRRSNQWAVDFAVKQVSDSLVVVVVLNNNNKNT